MDFYSVLNAAAGNQGPSSAPKRYSLKPGPPKKDPKVKGVNSSAVQAFLRKQEQDQKKKDLERKKQKEDLLAKRVELKSDRKARAMASRTKDNFKGYNGIPIVEEPKKRQSKSGAFDKSPSACDIEDGYEYAETDSESEPEPMPAERPQVANDQSLKISSAPKKNSALPKAAPPLMNFADLLKLAEKKQFEPVELKPTKKPEKRLRTAEEIREYELERKVKKQDRGRDSNVDRNLGQKDSKSGSTSHKKNVTDRDGRESKTHKSSSERPTSGISKMPKPHTSSERPQSSAKSSHGIGSKPSLSSSGALSGKAAGKGGAPVLSKQAAPKPQAAPKSQLGQKLTTTSDLTSKTGYSGLSQAKTSSSGSRPGPTGNATRLSGQGQGIKMSSQARISQSNSSKGGPLQKHGKGEMTRPGSNAAPRLSSEGPVRSTPGAFPKQAGTQPQKPGASSQGRPGPGFSRPSANGPNRPTNSGGVPPKPQNSMGQGPGRPQCTVVSETISSKNFAPRPGMAPRPAVPQGPRTVVGPTGHRILVRPAGPALPPITSSYKRKYEDEEEYDSEMDDFIDDEGDGQDEISKHIREIFGYDRNKYKDESDYALKFMESSWKEQQKEEARSLRMAVLEDQEEEQRELEELKQKQTKWRKMTLRLGIKEDEEDIRMEEEEMKKKLAKKMKPRKT